MVKLKSYFELTKPGIALMAGFSSSAGFLLGSSHPLNFQSLIHSLVGALLTAGGACALNMVFEKDVDSKMKRTERRPLPQGRLRYGEGRALGIFLSLAGILYLFIFVNLTTAVLGLASCATYLCLYTPLKKLTALCTVVGAVSGALPPIMGWTAATGSLDEKGIALFAVLFLWQFPHFLSMAWLNKEDYAKAGLHVLPWVNPVDSPHGMERIAGAWMALTSAGLILAGGLPTLMGRAGNVYLGGAFLLGLLMTFFSVRFYFDPSRQGARNLFLASLIYIPGLFSALIVNRIILLGAF